MIELTNMCEFLSLMCLCVYGVYAWVYLCLGGLMCVQVGIYKCTRKRRAWVLIFGIFIDFFPPSYSLRQGLSIEPRGHRYSWYRESACFRDHWWLPSECWDYSHGPFSTKYLRGFWRCKLCSSLMLPGSPFTTEPSPQITAGEFFKASSCPYWELTSWYLRTEMARLVA